MIFRVPGSLILMGEYAVLEEGGMALTAAVHPCAEGELTDEGILEGLQGDGRWSTSIFMPPSRDGSCREGDLPGCCLAVLGEYAAARGYSFYPQGVRVCTDRFIREGRKLGYGSSAAAAFAFMKGMTAGQNWKLSKEDLIYSAFRAHRLFQGGRGSGYDVYTSASRRICLYRNGSSPSIEPLDLTFLPDLYLYHSPASTSTIRGVDLYGRWKRSHPGEWSGFTARSEQLIRDFMKCRTWEEGYRIVQSAAGLGLGLGEAIGLSAEAAVPDAVRRCSGTVWKASGAGNELTLIFSPHDLSSLPGVERVRLYEE